MPIFIPFSLTYNLKYYVPTCVKYSTNYLISCECRLLASSKVRYKISTLSTKAKYELSIPCQSLPIIVNVYFSLRE